MSELVNRLRTLDGLRCPTERELEAAARIEALEAALREAIDELRWHDAVTAANEASAALAPEQDHETKR